MQFQGISFRLGVVDAFRNICAVVWAFAFVSESGFQGCGCVWKCESANLFGTQGK
ncbi:GM19465 [Drosophila sechellia]|uniref:GM19465 n=1 Tax=Drosophila sechellia TaxID=7238 RepID=B4HN14_DROSE|nr:GM19465 [Drosophila sechellia]